MDSAATGEWLRTSSGRARTGSTLVDTQSSWSCDGKGPNNTNYVCFPLPGASSDSGLNVRGAASGAVLGGLVLGPLGAVVRNSSLLLFSLSCSLSLPSPVSPPETPHSPGSRIKPCLKTPLYNLPDTCLGDCGSCNCRFLMSAQLAGWRLAGERCWPEQES